MATTRTWVTDERWTVVVRDASSLTRRRHRRGRRTIKGVDDVAAAKDTEELTLSDDADADADAASPSRGGTATKTWKTWFLSTIESGNEEAMGVVMTMRTASCKA